MTKTEEVNFVYCINCFEREDRYNASLKTLNDAGFTNIKWIRNHLHKIGRIGCTKAHLQVYKDIVESNLPYGIIFEDDIKFVDNYNKGIEGLKEYLNQVKGWDMFFFGCKRFFSKLHNKIFFRGKFVNFHAYAITRSMANTIINEHKFSDYNFQLDLLIITKYPSILQFCLKTPVAIQRKSKSNNSWLGHSTTNSNHYEKKQIKNYRCFFCFGRLLYLLFRAQYKLKFSFNKKN